MQCQSELLQCILSKMHIALYLIFLKYVYDIQRIKNKIFTFSPLSRGHIFTRGDAHKNHYLWWILKIKNFCLKSKIWKDNECFLLKNNIWINDSVLFCVWCRILVWNGANIMETIDWFTWIIINCVFGIRRNTIL